MTITKTSSGVAKAGLATGTVGATLGVLNMLGNGAGLLSGLTGNNCGARVGTCVSCNGCGCNEDRLVTRYDAEKDARIAQLETQVALRDANTHADEKNAEIVSYFNGRLREIETQLAKQAVENQKTADSFQIVSERMQCCCDKLEEKICCEAKERKCADNSIVNYVNSTFYAKQVGTVSTTTPNTSQILYNPLPTTGNACCCD